LTDRRRTLSGRLEAAFAGFCSLFADQRVRGHGRSPYHKAQGIKQSMSYQKSNKQWQDIALPLILFLTGVILLGGDWLGVLSLDRIANLWPCAFILAGLAEAGAGTTTQRRL
jgi:hypothetical protein